MKTTDEVRPSFRRLVYGLWAVGWIILAAACQPEPDNKPDNLIPEEKMVQILTDIHLAEATVSKMGISASDSMNMVYKRMEKKIYARYQLDTGTYYKSYIYYSSNPEKLVELYKKVVEKLEAKQTNKR